MDEIELPDRHPVSQPRKMRPESLVVILLAFPMVFVGVLAWAILHQATWTTVTLIVSGFSYVAWSVQRALGLPSLVSVLGSFKEDLRRAVRRAWKRKRVSLMVSPLDFSLVVCKNPSSIEFDLPPITDGKNADWSSDGRPNSGPAPSTESKTSR